MLNQIKDYIASRPLKWKITAIALVDMILITFIAVAGLQYVVNINNQQLYKSVAVNLSYSATEIDRTLEAIENISNSIISDDIIQQSLSVIKDSDDYIARSDAYSNLYTSVQTNFTQSKQHYVSYITLYNDDFATHSYAARAEQLPDSILDEILTQAREADGRSVWINQYSDSYGVFLTRLVRRAQNTKLDSIGILVICINLEELIEASISFTNAYGESLYFLKEEENILYNTYPVTEKDQYKITSVSNNSYEILNLEAGKYFSVSGLLTTIPWEYTYLVSYDSIYNSIFISQIIYMIMIILGFILAFFLSRIFIKGLIRHFDNLTLKMRAFGGHDAEIIDVDYDYQKRNDEIGILHRNFDDMAHQIQHLINVNYVNELLKKDAQLKALETQINPHFLYNTLESINWRAKSVGEKPISMMVESLGNLLRMTLSNKNKNFTLRQELELVQNYMSIQQIRFEERLQYTLTVNEGVLDAEIPKLTIQPLVENSIHYALEQVTEECQITVNILQNDKNLEIYVKNDGSQFAEDLLAKLSNKEITPHGFGIGLLNIHQRLQLTFGNDYGLFFYNELNKAIVKITIPYRKSIT